MNEKRGVWPEKAEGEDRKKLRIEITNFQEEIERHFGNDLEGTWLDQEGIDSRISARLGSRIFLKYGYCEYCINYIGPSSEVRRINNIYVINGFCSVVPKNHGAVKPDHRCWLWNPDKFYKSIIKRQVAKLIIRDKEIANWVKLKGTRWPEDDY